MNGQLIEKLKEFKGVNGKEADLKEQFENIATYLMTGGYILCDNKYRLYISSVEFYYHEESGENRIEDPVMYHRNKENKRLNIVEEIEYFPIGTFYPHQSGVDITFECPGKYRASALIREFYITKADTPNEYHNCKYFSPDSGWQEERSIDRRPTYVYEWLFRGLGMGRETFCWIEEKNESIEVNTNPLRRIHVREYGEREWRFSIK